MATSGDITLTFTRDQIIQEAYELLQVVEPGVAASAAQVTSAARTLNNMIKAWQSKGLAVHSVQGSWLFPEADQAEYQLDSSGGDRWTTSYTETTAAAVAASGAATITVASDADISNTDIIGIYQDDGTMHWTTVNGAPVADVVTLTDVTTDEVSVGAIVYNYTVANEAERPMEIVEVWERNSDGNDRPLDLVDRNQYAELTLKSNTGGVVSVFYDSQVGTDNRLYLWPIPDDSRMIIGTWVKRTFETFTAAGNEVDLPQEAFEAVAYGLAKRMITKSAAKQMTAQFITGMATQMETDLFDDIAGPEASVLFQPDMDGYG